ncbi:ATP-grasp fold amidoligase family protein, partial [Thalassobacillus sp. B23F22_16]|uniref:ATP-grasp fold amidoligase family protein n=1 Tax=Thalassobacillus sp. B23F22_16 TaxID=3459513 RepID=UPI00373DF94A
LYVSARDTDKKGIFMSPEWKFLSAAENKHNKYNKPHRLPEKPVSLENMIAIAKELSKPFPFVRVDFYECDNQVVFGELTFTPGSGIYTSQTSIQGKTMGELLDISGEVKKKLNNK